MASPPALALDHVRRAYRSGAETLTVLHDATLTVAAGELAALVAPSGAGKSTLLHIAGLLERPDAGDVIVDGHSCAKASDQQRTLIRCAAIGFVWQAHHLQAEFSALENVMLPQLLAGVAVPQARQRADTLLERVGLSARRSHRPGQLSGGERQRVALARALAHAPCLLLADEPTGSLDPRSAARVFDLLLSLARAEGMAALIVTHDHTLAQRLDRVLTLHEGRLATAAAPGAS